jgi:hypothetical protein
MTLNDGKKGQTRFKIRADALAARDCRSRPDAFATPTTRSARLRAVPAA